MPNPLISDRDVDFILHELLDVSQLCELPTYADHDRETFDLMIASSRKFSREVLFPSYRKLDEAPPELVDGRVKVHPDLRELYPRMVELGGIAATRPYDVGGQQLPFVIFALSGAYMMAANLSVYAYGGLTTGAARLIESFGSDALKEEYMTPMYEGRWTGTMALTEPDAGSSLADVTTRAIPQEGGHYLIEGSKVFISGGDQDITDNIVHLTLARIEGAPPGIKGVSLFAIPARRKEGDDWVDNDCATAGVFHKIGWRALPSIALNFGERGDCHGYLVGEPHRGIRYMFQMMNEARLMVGMNAAATASVAYQESLAYAKDRPQGRRMTDRDPGKPQIPIIEHADVRRMLLRQKAIVEASFSLLATASMYQDLAEHGAEAERERYATLLDLLTPICKTFPAERGMESNTLAVQIHGGYGYTSEYLPEAWWRDQKLNSIHEGTTGIQGLDLLGRKVMRNGGAALRLFAEVVGEDIAKAREAGVDAAWCDALQEAVGTVGGLTMHLGGLGMSGNVDAMLLHSNDYLELFGILVFGWQWLNQARLSVGKDDDFYAGKLCAAQYWMKTEIPRIAQLAALCQGGDDAYARCQPGWF